MKSLSSNETGHRIHSPNTHTHHRNHFLRLCSLLFYVELFCFMVEWGFGDAENGLDSVDIFQVMRLPPAK